MSEAETTPTVPETEETPEEQVEAEAGGAEGAENEGEEAAPQGDDEEEEMTVDLDALPKMKVGELKDILKALDLPTTGIKTTLIERIQEHFAEEDKEDDVPEEKEEASE